MKEPHILETEIKPAVRIKPLHNFILIQKISDPNNLILMPDGVSNPLHPWVVLEAAEEVTCVKEGDNVLLSPAAQIVAIDQAAGIGLIPVNAVVGILK